MDGSGRITTAHWVEADGDDEATALAREGNFGLKCEVWDGDRFVVRIITNPGAAPEPA
jgi:hypothetical protein